MLERISQSPTIKGVHLGISHSHFFLSSIMNKTKLENKNTQQNKTIPGTPLKQEIIESQFHLLQHSLYLIYSHRLLLFLIKIFSKKYIKYVWFFFLNLTSFAWNERRRKKKVLLSWINSSSWVNYGFLFSQLWLF